jgi:hypothetical protein
MVTLFPPASIRMPMPRAIFPAPMIVTFMMSLLYVFLEFNFFSLHGPKTTGTDHNAVFNLTLLVLYGIFETSVA